MLTEQGNLESTYELLRASLQFLRAAGQVHEFSIEMEDTLRESGTRDIEWTVAYRPDDRNWLFIRGATIEEVSRRVQEHFRVAFDAAETKSDESSPFIDSLAKWQQECQARRAAVGAT